MNNLSSQSRLQQSRNKVKNILIRHCGCKKVRNDCLADEKYEHPENCYLAKYFPKYYHNLTLLMKPGSLLSSKMKRIKKLGRFAGKFHGWIPPVNWFKILKHNRKEIEEFPQMHLSQDEYMFWGKLTLRVVKLFFNVTRLQVPTFPSRKFDGKHFLDVWKAFSVHLGNMRRLKTLEVRMNRLLTMYFDPNVLKSLYQRLNKMPRLLQQLEVLKSPFRFDVFQGGFLQKNHIFSNLTNLSYLSVSFGVSETCQTIPLLCKNLKSFSLQFENHPTNTDSNLNHSQSRYFITSLQELPKLQSISIHWSHSWPFDFWSYFTPPVSLRRLAFNFKVSEMRDAFFQDSSSNESENFVNHWKQIKELDALDLDISCRDDNEMLFTKDFITEMLKKISRLTSFQCKTIFKYHRIWRYEPFFIEEVPHLYEHLKKFKVKFVFSEGCISFDLSFLRPFKNLKEIKCKGCSDSWLHIEDAVHLLEENTKYGEFTTLKLGSVDVTYQEELKDLLKRIYQAKKNKNNLKIMLALNFDIQAGDDEVIYLDQFCKIIESEMVEGLEISLLMRYQDFYEYYPDEVREVLEEHPQLKNFELKIDYDEDILEYIKRDGEKEQFLFYSYDDLW